MENSPRDLQRGVGGGDDGEHKARRLDSVSRAGAEAVDLSLRLSLGGRFGAERRSGEGQPQGSGFPGSTAAEVQPSATPLNTIKEEEEEEEPVAKLPSQGILTSTGSLPAGIEGGSRKRKAEDLKRLEAKRRRVWEMPLVCTSGLPNGRRVVGLLYNYSKVDEVRIWCMCHGSFLSPAEFVEHAGGGRVANPLRSILVKPSWL